MSTTLPYVVQTQYFMDDRGVLRSLDGFPFEPVRMFWITNVPIGAVRGGHAHKKDWQFLACTIGSVWYETNPVGKQSTGALLLSAGECLVLPPMNFLTLERFSVDCVLTVLCSHPYDPDDYILPEAE